MGTHEDVTHVSTCTCVHVCHLCKHTCNRNVHMRTLLWTHTHTGTHREMTGHEAGVLSSAGSVPAHSGSQSVRSAKVAAEHRSAATPGPKAVISSKGPGAEGPGTGQTGTAPSVCLNVSFAIMATDRGLMWESTFLLQALAESLGGQLRVGITHPSGHLPRGQALRTARGFVCCHSTHSRVGVTEPRATHTGSARRCTGPWGAWEAPFPAVLPSPLPLTATCAPPSPPHVSSSQLTPRARAPDVSHTPMAAAAGAGAGN
jgi:hypothetical protein